MPWLRRNSRLVRRLVLRLAILVIALPLIAVAILNLWQLSARRRIGRTLKVVRSLEQRRASTEEVKRELARLGVGTAPECAQDRCTFQFTLDHPDFEGDSWQRWMLLRMMDDPMHAVVEGIGFRPVRLVAAVVTEDGKTQRTSVGLYVGVSPLLVAGRRMARFLPVLSDNPALHAHPDYWVRRRPHLKTPGGGEGVSVEITPDASQEAMGYSWDYDLACITSWGGCGSVDRLMPGAARLASLTQSSDDYKYGSCSVRHMVRDSEIVLLATVDAVEPYRGTWEKLTEQIVRYRLDEIISNRRNQKVEVHRVRQFVRKGGFNADPFRPGLSREIFRPGRHLVLFFQAMPPPLDFDCSVMPADPQLLQVVRQEIIKAGDAPK